MMVPPLVLKVFGMVRFCALLMAPPSRFKVIPDGNVCNTVTSRISPANTLNAPALPAKLLPVDRLSVMLLFSASVLPAPMLINPALTLLPCRLIWRRPLRLKLPPLSNGTTKRVSTVFACAFRMPRFTKPAMPPVTTVPRISAELLEWFRFITPVAPTVKSVGSVTEVLRIIRSEKLLLKLKVPLLNQSTLVVRSVPPL